MKFLQGTLFFFFFLALLLCDNLELGWASQIRLPIWYIAVGLNVQMKKNEWNKEHGRETMTEILLPYY